MLKLITGNESENDNGFGGNGFGGGGSMSLSSCTFGDTFTGNDNDLEEKSTRFGNYRGSRYKIVSEKGSYMTLQQVKGSGKLEVSSCNVSDISTSPSSKEVICPGNNLCREEGLKQGPYCTPIRPSEGILKYPSPI